MPRTVNVNVPRGVCTVLMVKTDGVPGVTEGGANELDEPAGSPVTDSKTDPANPLTELTVTV